MLRVLITAPWGQRLGGAESMLWTFLRGHDRDRVRLHVVFLQPGPFEREVATLGIPTTVVPAGRLREPGRVLRSVTRMRRIIRRERPDVILNWAAKTHVYGALAGLLAGTGTRQVWWQHGIPNGGWLDRLATALPSAAVGCSSRAVADAQSTLAPRRRTFVVHPGLEPAALEAERGNRHAPEALGIPPDRRIVGIVGRLQEWKGQDRFLVSLAELRRRGHPVHGLIVGGEAYGLSPGYGARLAAMVQELGLEGAVTMTGHTEDARPYIASMDVLVNLSRGEPFGMVLLEGMALGKPVVALAEGGPLEIVEPEHSGLLLGDPAPTAVADAVERLLVDDGLRERVAENGRRRFASHFTSERMIETLQDELVHLHDGRG